MQTGMQTNPYETLYVAALMTTALKKAFDSGVAAIFMGQLPQSLFQAAPHTMLLPLLSVTQLLNLHSPLSSDTDCRMHMTTVKAALLC